MPAPARKRDVVTPEHADPFDNDEWWDPDGFLFGLHELLNPIRVPFIVEQLRAAGAVTVLDVGCGGGFLSEALVNEGFSVTGLDRSLGAIAAAGDSGTRSATYLTGDAHALPFSSGSFDAVVLSETLEHVDRPRVAFAEATRVLAPGGILVVTGPNRTILSRIILIWLAQKWPTRVLPRHLHEHRSFLTPQHLASWCENSGLQPRAIRGIGIAGRDLVPAARALIRLRLGRVSYPAAARAIKLRANHTPVIAFMVTATKTPHGIP